MTKKHGWLEEGAILPDPKVVSKAIQEIQADAVPQETSGVEPHRAFVKMLLQHADISVTVVYQRLVEAGYTGSYSSVRRFVAKLRGPTIPEGFCRVEVAPGTEAQVDFGFLGILFDPIQQKSRAGCGFFMTGPTLVFKGWQTCQERKNLNIEYTLSKFTQKILSQSLKNRSPINPLFQATRDQSSHS